VSIQGLQCINVFSRPRGFDGLSAPFIESVSSESLNPPTLLNCKMTGEEKNDENYDNPPLALASNNEL
jgi:hypothetical protein